MAKQKTTLREEHDESVKAMEAGQIQEHDAEVKDDDAPLIPEGTQSKRQQIMDDIAARRAAAEGVEPDEPEEPAETAEAAADEPEDDQDEPEDDGEDELSSEADPETPVYLKDGKWYATIKVDGQEEEVPFDELLANNQKAVSGDQRLREAAEERRKILAYRQDLEAYEKQLLKLEQDRQKDVEQSLKQQRKDLAKKYREALDVGNEDEADDYLLQLTELQRDNTPAFDPNRIAQDASARADEVVQMRLRQNEEQRAVADFISKDENKPLWQDVRVRKMIDATIDELQSIPKWKNATPAQLLDEAASQVRESMTKVVGKANGSFTEKRGKVRRASQNAPTSTGTRSGSPATAQNKGPQNVKDYISERRKAHHLPTS